MQFLRRLAGTAILMLAGLSGGRGENLLLITVDTLRADRLSCYGYPAGRTPGFDRWAAEGIRFERAYAEVPLTLPSHSTLLTGTYPFYHGVRDNAGFRLPGDQLTLAEILLREGYHTAAFIGAYVLASRFGTSQGFEVFDEEFPLPRDFISGSSLRRDAPEVTDRFLEWLEGNRQKKFFAWVHFYDPHSPYPKGYDYSVQAVDRALQRIDERLRQWDLKEKTHIFLLADHGEALGEHQESTHGFFIYDSTLHIPWIIRPASSFSFREKVISEPVSLVDVLPTALQMLGLPVPEQVQGRSLLRAMLGRPGRPGRLYAETLMPQVQFGWAPLRSLRLGRYKYIDAPRPELYDLVRDPGETRNLFEENQALASRYREELEELTARFSNPDQAGARLPVDAETAQRLAALGYAALAAPRNDSERGSGVDPKDRIQVFEAYQQILARLHSDPTPQLLLRIGALREQAPEIRGLFYLEGLVLERHGEWAEAARAYEEALREDPGNNLARGNLANMYLRLQRFSQAEQTLQEVLRRDPADYRARNNLALLLQMKGEAERALPEFERITREAPFYAPGWVNLGVALGQAGRWGEAELALRRALELEPEHAAAYLHLARALRAQGKEEEARRALETAYRLDPRLRQKP